MPNTNMQKTNSPLGLFKSDPHSHGMYEESDISARCAGLGLNLFKPQIK